MSIDLGTRSSAVVNGRCAGCGRFISRNESHFHSPPRRFRGRPKVHLWDEGGGCVTRCDDIVTAQFLIKMAYLRHIGGSPSNDEDRAEADRLFPADAARVQRGRWNVYSPGWDYDVLWYPLPDQAKGPGITTAVVW